ERVGERDHGAERGARVDRDREPVQVNPEVGRRSVAPNDAHLEPRGVGAEDRARVGGREHEATADPVDPEDRPAVERVRRAGKLRREHDGGLVGEHVAAVRRVPVDAGREQRVDDGDLARGTVVRAMARRREPLHACRDEQDGADEREPAPRHLVSVAFANASGRRSRNTQRRSVFGPTAITWRSSPNSASSWRHAPHGDAGGSTSVATTMRLNPRAPSAIAAPIAIRSAQMVSPYEALSTLAPTNTPPSAASSAAPTRHVPEGQDAFFCPAPARPPRSTLPPP